MESSSLERIISDSHRVFAEGEAQHKPKTHKPKAKLLPDDKYLEHYLLSKTTAAFWNRFFRISKAAFGGIFTKNETRLIQISVCLLEATQCLIDLYQVAQGDSTQQGRPSEEKSTHVNTHGDQLSRVFVFYPGARL